MEHTEGGWGICDYGPYDFGIIANANKKDDVQIARVDDVDVPAEQAEANAHLIAAAPDLLAACDEGFHECERVKMYCTCEHKDIAGLLRRIERIEAAIKKALPAGKVG
jgi:hypothetical protein